MKSNGPITYHNKEFAFPSSSSRGMDLRDYFAGQALQGLITNGEIPTSKLEVAACAVEYADALIEFLNKE